MKPVTCTPPLELEALAREAEARKHRALDRLAAKLDTDEPDTFERAMRALIDADKRALEARGR